MNPKLARVQVEGGAVQAIGMALYEDVRYSSNGRLETNNFMTYKIPTRQDIGELHTAFVESYEESGAYGVKSIGEIVINYSLSRNTTCCKKCSWCGYSYITYDT